MKFDAVTLTNIVEELQELVGGKVQRIAQPQPLQIVLSVFARGAEKHLLIDVSARYYRAHFTTQRAKNPPSPSPFCATLRKYLIGARVLEVSQRGGDRILDIKLEREGEEFLLTAELMGKHANLILVSSHNKILQAVKLITKAQSRVREIAPGQEYSAPPAPRFSEIKSLTSAQKITSAQLDEYYALEAPRLETENEIQNLRAALEKTLKQKTRVLEQVRRGAQESTQAETYRRWGELLLGNMRQAQEQLETSPHESEVFEVEVLDFYDESGASAKIPLKTDQSVSQNAERLFARARHVEENALELQKLQSDLEQEVTEIEELLKQLEHTPAELQQLREQATARGWLRIERQGASTPGAQADEFSGYKIKRFRSPEGYEILVGENATSNDYLVTRLSHSNDWWLHLRAGTSAHAIIKTHNAPDRVQRSTLLHAAQLVAARSIAKHAAVADVDYTLRKYVRKPRKAAPGAVTYSHEKTLRVENEKS